MKHCLPWHVKKESKLLKEARETKDRIITEAKEQAKIEANKIISDAQAAIETAKNGCAHRC